MKAWLLATVALLAPLPALAQDADPLAAGFRDPPQEARPRSWWHWLNGNVTEAGIDKDLAWMAAIGLGGVQNFDASLGTPQIVAKRLSYMSPEWKQAFAHAVRVAHAHRLEFAIAGSPGWSESGGPWVAPQDGMKKLVWSSTLVAGGHRFAGPLAPPPTATGPFGTAPFHDPLAATTGAEPPPPPSAGGTIAVLAVPDRAGDDALLPAATGADGRALEAAALVDGREDTALTLSFDGKGEAVAATLAYPQPRTVQTATVFLPGGVPPFGAPPYLPTLEAETANGWQAVATLPMANVPTTVAFAPVTARRFRLRLPGFVPATPPAMEPPAPGAEMVNIFGGGPAGQIRLATLSLSAAPRVDRFEAKAGFATVPDYYALDKALPATDAPAPDTVIDLTGRLRADGTLDWTPPPGRWRVLRFGWSLLGTTNHPAAPDAIGLEVDKYDGGAVRRYFEHYLDTYAGALGAGAKIDALLTDSIEAGDANWTPAMLAEFKARRGYDPTPWLPVLSGMVIGTRAASDAFLFDYRQTLAELLASAHYGTLAEIAHARGMRVYGEALEDRRPQLGNDIAMRSHADVPMAAMWAFGEGGKPRPTMIGDDLGAASVAHVYGRPYVAAEMFTAAFAPWAFAPNDLRPVADLAFALGINRPVIHTSVHSPDEDKLPGLSLAIFGQYFNRHESWARLARPWVEYLARTGYLLQQGTHVADIAYFFGEEAPLTQLYADGRLTQLPTTHGFDFVDAGALGEALSVRDGVLQSKGGARYRVLYLGGTAERMTLPVLRRVAALAEAGATIIGTAPTGSPSLADDAAAYRALVARLWAGGAEATVGAGRVIATRDLPAALQRLQLAPDFASEEAPNAAPPLFQHRVLADGHHVYFVLNRGAARTVTARFRVQGLLPELWHADTGTSEPLRYRVEQGATVVPLTLAAERGALVVFRTPSADAAQSMATRTLPLATLSGPWTVTFQPGRGAPGTTTLATLAPLDESADPRIRYFSGEATYARSFTPPPGWRAGQPLWIDLGRVGDVAEVQVNGRVAGIAWQLPNRLEIGGLVHRGANALTVTVANLWVNRLIGDAQPGAAKVAWVAAPTYRPDAPLRPSGLIGPVVLMGAQR